MALLSCKCTVYTITTTSSALLVGLVPGFKEGLIKQNFTVASYLNMKVLVFTEPGHMQFVF